MTGRLERFRRRMGQGLRALTAFSRPIDYAVVESILTPELTTLFKRMRRSEQEHSIRVMRTLRSQGHTQPDLLVAALLHDVGKSRCPYTLFDRVLIVLVGRLITWNLIWYWGKKGNPRGWRRPFVVAVQHPIWSAEDMAQAGATPLAVTLARHHQDKLGHPPQSEEERLLVLLQEADNLN